MPLDWNWLRAGVIGLLLALNCSALADTGPPVDELAPDVERGRIEPGSTGTAWLEERWPGRYEIAEVEVRVPTERGAEHLDHRLRVEVLDDDGAWVVVSEVHVVAEAFEEVGRSVLEDDPEVVAFLEARGLTVAQFEFFAQSPAADTVLLMWELQGIAREDVPEAIVHHLEADEDAAGPDADDAPSDGWRTVIGWAVHTQRLELPVLAGAVRFSLEGDGIVGGAWQIVLRTVGLPDDIGGVSAFEMEYAHAW